MTWAIRGKQLYTGTGDPAVRDAVVVIDDKRITAVGPATQVALPDDIDVMDIGDRTIMPGLIDAHRSLRGTAPFRWQENRSQPRKARCLEVACRNVLLYS